MHFSLKSVVTKKVSLNEEFYNWNPHADCTCRPQRDESTEGAIH